MVLLLATLATLDTLVLLLATLVLLLLATLLLLAGLLLLETPLLLATLVLLLPVSRKKILRLSSKEVLASLITLRTSTRPRLLFTDNDCVIIREISFSLLLVCSSEKCRQFGYPTRSHYSVHKIHPK